MSAFTPPTVLERRDWITDIGAAEIRCRCDISQKTIARALGVSQASVSGWETGKTLPAGDKAAAYCRIITGLARHLNVTGTGEDDPDSKYDRGLRETIRKAGSGTGGYLRAYAADHSSAHLIRRGQQTALCDARPREGYGWLGGTPRQAVRLSRLRTCHRCMSEALFAANIAAWDDSSHLGPGVMVLAAATLSGGRMPAGECAGCSRLRPLYRSGLCNSCIHCRYGRRTGRTGSTAGRSAA